MPTVVLIGASLYTIGSMAKKFVKRYMPDVHKIRHHRHLRFFGTLLHDPNLWHLNRHSVAGAMAVGLFWAFVPMPLQMIPAAAFAIWFRVNLPISVALVWLTNPITMPAVFYFNYKLGTWILRRPVEDVAFPVSDVKFELSWAWINQEWTWVTHEFSSIWQPFLLGSLVVASLSALAGYWGMRAFWRLHVVREWERRRKRRRK
jgi:uncharacterized protein (DUF2062 family)